MLYPLGAFTGCDKNVTENRPLSRQEDNVMDNMDKVEKLRERANVTYEEAKQALEENNWDLLDAMVSLEKQGKTKEPGQTTYSTSYEQQTEYLPVKETIEEKNRKKPRERKLRGMIRKFFRICRDNSFHVTKNGEEVIQVPVFVLVIALLIFWKPLIIVMLIALLFGFRYRFGGKDDLKGVNDFMDSAGDMADRVRAEFSNGEKYDGSPEADKGGADEHIEQ